MNLYANLDCEWHMANARSGGRNRPLPGAVLRRISLFGTLLRVFAEPGDRLLTPEEVPARCLRHVEGLPEPGLGRLDADQPQCDTRTAWCVPSAAATTCNDRAFAFHLAGSLGLRSSEARLLEDTAQRQDLLTPRGPWIFKASFSAAGRDRVVVDTLTWTTRPLDEDRSQRIHRLISEQGGGVLEPWVERTSDIGFGASQTPHATCVDGVGRFRGIVMPGPPLSEQEREQVARVREGVEEALARVGYDGPWGVDAWRFRDEQGKDRFQPFGELNARMTFGLVARALRERVAAPRWGEACAMALRFGTEPERADSDTIPLVGDSDGETMYAWLSRLPPPEPGQSHT